MYVRHQIIVSSFRQFRPVATVGSERRCGEVNRTTQCNTAAFFRMKKMAEQNVDNVPTDESLVKKMKIDELEETSKNANSVHDVSLRFSSFDMTRILNVNSMRKQLIVEGTFKGQESPAIVIMEKKVFPEDEIFLKRGFFNEGTIIRKIFSNDVYGNYECFPTREHNGLNVMIIHPASQKHLDKFSRKELYLINETYEIYETITLPFLEANSFSLQWVDNILSHKAEYDKIIYEDTDKEKGFIMLPDLKWDGQLATLDILVLARKRIRSMRELNDSHLPLLKNIRDTGIDVITKKYNLSSSQLRIYLHYQPSYYHLHVHFSYLMHEVPGIYCEKAHLISTVINNIEIVPDYYQKAVLSFVIKENDPLCKKYQESGILTVIDSPTGI